MIPCRGWERFTPSMLKVINPSASPECKTDAGQEIGHISA